MAILAAALVFLASCGGGHSSSTTGPSAGAGGRVANLGYGLPHYWNTVDPNGFAQLLVDHGLGMTVIEYRPLSLDRREVPPAVASRFLAAMRARQITTLVHIMNWNCRNRGVCPASMDDLVASVNRLASLGTSQLIVEVAEPNDPQGPQSVLLVRRAWPGAFAVNWGFPVPSGITWERPPRVPSGSGSVVARRRPDSHDRLRSRLDHQRGCYRPVGQGDAAGRADRVVEGLPGRDPRIRSQA